MVSAKTVTAYLFVYELANYSSAILFIFKYKTQALTMHYNLKTILSQQQLKMQARPGCVCRRMQFSELSQPYNVGYHAEIAETAYIQSMQSSQSSLVRHLFLLSFLQCFMQAKWVTLNSFNLPLLFSTQQCSICLPPNGSIYGAGHYLAGKVAYTLRCPNT